MDAFDFLLIGVSLWLATFLFNMFCIYKSRNWWRMSTAKVLLHLIGAPFVGWLCLITILNEERK